MFKTSCLVILLIYEISGDCPVWKCEVQQTNTGENPHCVEFTTDKVYLADKSQVCTSNQKTTCILLQAVDELNKYSNYNGVSSSFCTEVPTTSSSTYKFTVETLWGNSSYYNSEQYYFTVEKGCSDFFSYSYQCDYVYNEDEDEKDEENTDKVQETDKSYAWDTCSSNSDCQSNKCFCVPSSSTKGRCGTSFIDLNIIKIAQNAAACESDEVVVCTLSEFKTSQSAVLWISILEGDLDCVESQTWELEYQVNYDIQGAIDWYNKAGAESLIFLSGVLLYLL